MLKNNFNIYFSHFLMLHQCKRSILDLLVVKDMVNVLVSVIVFIFSKIKIKIE